MIDNIFDCFAQNICTKIGNPSGWNDNTYKTNTWYGKHMWVFFLKTGFI